MLTGKNELCVPLPVTLQYMFIIYMWKSNIWYNKQRLKLHLAFLMVYFILYKQLKMAFLRQNKSQRQAAMPCRD